MDIQSKEIIKLALQKFEGTLIVISHDREFLQGLCDKIFEFRDGRMKEFIGNIDEYLEFRQKESIREISAEKAKLHGEALKVEEKKEEIKVEKAAESTASKILSKEQKQVYNKLKKVEEKISELETAIESFEKEFATQNPSDEKLEVYNSKKEELDLALQEWEHLGSQIDV